MSIELEETRAAVARRRLADLAAAFEAQVPAPERIAGGRHVVASSTRPRLTGWHVKVVVVLAVAAVVVTVWWLLSARPNYAPSPEQPPFPTASSVAAAPSAASEIVIDVTGKVRHRGIVTLPAGSRVADALKAAGGATGSLNGLNLARKLADGEQVIVGQSASAPVAGSASGAGSGGAGPGGALNLNTATQDQLEELPGIGPVTAEAIIAWRTEHGPFTAVDDLLEVTGIGPKTLDDMRSRVTG